MTEIMSAATLTIRRGEQFGSATPPASFDRHFLSSRIGVRLREQRCPSCDSIVYSRRHSQCGVCERALPVSFLFTDDEAEKVEVLLKTERQRHRAWLTRIEAGSNCVDA